MSFQFNLMQIYIANRPTEPQNYCIYTHQTTKGFYIHQQVKYKHKFKKKKKKRETGLPNNSASPKQEYLYNVHYQHMQKTKWVMQDVKNLNPKLHNENIVQRVISAIFLWRSVLVLTRILFPCLVLFKCVTCIAPFYVLTCTIFSALSLKR